MRKSISKGEWELRFTTGDFRDGEWLADDDDCWEDW